VAVNVAALPAELLESELFGHGKGAFTGADRARRGLFEEANGGTLFLDEVGEMPLPLQAKLLRALQDGELRRVGESQSFAVDVRIVCATHRDLARLVQQGTFREDLFYRLKVLTIRVPSLRERPEDVLPLAQHFLSQEPTEAAGFSPEARALLQRYPWPGNVRELQNAVKHGAALATGPEVQRDDLPEELLVAEAPTPDRGARPPGGADDRARLRSLAEVEQEHILRVLDACGGSQTEAARVLGVGRNTLWRKLRQLPSLAGLPRKIRGDTHQSDPRWRPQQRVPPLAPLVSVAELHPQHAPRPQRLPRLVQRVARGRRGRPLLAAALEGHADQLRRVFHVEEEPVHCPLIQQRVLEFRQLQLLLRSFRLRGAGLRGAGLFRLLLILHGAPPCAEAAPPQGSPRSR
jgi:two-component system response regulator HydG